MNIYIVLFHSENCTGFDSVHVGQEGLKKFIQKELTIFSSLGGLFVKEYNPSGELVLSEEKLKFWKDRLLA